MKKITILNLFTSSKTYTKESKELTRGNSIGGVMGTSYIIIIIVITIIIHELHFKSENQVPKNNGQNRSRPKLKGREQVWSNKDGG